MTQKSKYFPNHILAAELDIAVSFNNILIAQMSWVEVIK